jgi:hypothetical protein
MICWFGWTSTKGLFVAGLMSFPIVVSLDWTPRFETRNAETVEWYIPDLFGSGVLIGFDEFIDWPFFYGAFIR